MEMYERQVLAGEILIKEGDRGLAASELYVIKSGQFEVITTLADKQRLQASGNLKAFVQIRSVISCANVLRAGP